MSNSSDDSSQSSTETAETDRSFPDADADAEPAESVADDTESEWKFAIDDVGPEAEAKREEERQESMRTRPIEPESIRLENAIFVVIGVALTIVLILTAV